MGVIRDFIDGILNPYKYETDIEREERHRREQRQHEIDLAKIRSEGGRGSYRKRSNHYDRDGSDRDDPLEREFGFLDGWGSKKRK